MSRIILAQVDVEVGPVDVQPGEVIDLGVNPVTGETPGDPGPEGVDAHGATPAADAAHGAADPAGVPEAAHGAFPAFDATMFASHLFWLLVSFGLLYLVVNRFIVPRVGGIVDDRNSRIANDVGEATRLSRETDEIISAYETELTAARQRAFGIAQARRDELKVDQARRQAETETALNQRIMQSEREIMARRDAALRDVDAIATEVAQAIVARVAGVTVPADQAREAVVRTEVARAAD